MISTRPNLAYLKAAWAAHAGISAENSRQSYDDAGITFERVSHSWIVYKDGIQIATMPPRYTREELRMGFLGRIEMEARKAAAELETCLLHELALPEGYAVITELEAAMRGLRRSGHRTLSILMGPTDAQADPAPIFVELRVFLDAPRACLFVHQGGVDGAASTDLLTNVPRRERNPRASSYAELAKLVAGTIEQAMEQLPAMSFAPQDYDIRIAV